MSFEALVRATTHRLELERASPESGNIAGIEAELDVLRWVPAPVAVQRKVRAPNGACATVDIVAARGLWWVEVKAGRPFSTDSRAWDDLQAQTGRLLGAAACSLAGRHRPRVLVVFAAGCTPEVATALSTRSIGVVVGSRLPSPMDLAGALHLPLALLRPRPALLDRGTLLALVSDTLHMPPSAPALRAWAAGNAHWSRSLDEEATAPVLPALETALAEHPRWLARTRAALRPRPRL
jgi:hypothetical protein